MDEGVGPNRNYSYGIPPSSHDDLISYTTPYDTHQTHVNINNHNDISSNSNRAMDVNYNSSSQVKKFQFEKSGFRKGFGSGSKLRKNDPLVNNKTGDMLSPHETRLTNNSTESKKSFKMPTVSVMSCGCSICGKTSQSGVGGICKGCWAQFKERGIKIGTLDDFKNFTEAVSDQVSRIVTVNPENKSLIDSVQSLVPQIFVNDKEFGRDSSPSFTKARRSLSVQPESQNTKTEFQENSEDAPQIPAESESPKTSDTDNLKLGGSNDRISQLTRSKTLNFPGKNGKESENNKLKMNATTSASNVTRAKTEWNMKRFLTKNGREDKNKSKDNISVTSTLASTKTLSSVSLSSQKGSNNKTLTRSRTMNSKDNKVRYVPTTIKESKELEEKKKLSKSQNNLKINKIANKEDKNKENAKNKGKNGVKNVRRKVNSSLSLLNKSKLMSRNVASSDEEDEDDELSNRNSMPVYSAKEKLMVKGQNSDSNEELEMKHNNPSNNYQSSIEQNNSPQNQRESSCCLRDRLLKYGKIGDDKTSIKNSSKTELPAVKQIVHQEMFKQKSDNDTYFEKPSPYITSFSTIQQTVPNNTEENYYNNDKSKTPVTDEIKRLAENLVTKTEIESNKSIYYDCPKALSSYQETGIDSSEYTDYTYSDTRKAITAADFSGGNFSNALTRDIVLGSGESPTSVRRNYTIADNVESGGIFDIAKRFGPTQKFQQFEYQSKTLSLTGDAKRSENLLNKTNDSAYTGGLFRNPMMPVETSNTKEVKQIENKPYSSDQFYFGSENVQKFTPVKPESKDNDTYTGEVFRIPQVSMNSKVRTFNNKFSPVNNFSQSTENLNNVVRSAINEANKQINDNSENTKNNAINVALKCLTGGNSTKQMNRMNRKRQSKVMDSFIEKSVESAGEFFSKTIMNFRPPINVNNSSNEVFEQANLFRQDKLEFSNYIQKDDYTDYKPGFKPCCTKPVKKKEEVIITDISKYEKYDEEDGQYKRKETVPENQQEWYADTAEDFIGPVNVTWDGRDWPGSGSLRNNLRDSDFDGDGYAANLLCNKYNMNNNYPDYSKYASGQSMERERKKTPPPPPTGNDEDYSPCLFSNCPAFAASRQPPPKPKPEPKPKPQPANFYFDYKEQSARFNFVDDPTGHADYAGYSPQLMSVEETAKPNAPPKPKVVQVGSLTIRNNVEDDDDYAENINRDIGQADPEPKTFGTSVDDDSGDFTTQVFDGAMQSWHGGETVRRESLSLKTSKKPNANARRNITRNNIGSDIDLLDSPDIGIEKSLVKQVSNKNPASIRSGKGVPKI